MKGSPRETQSTRSWDGKRRRDCGLLGALECTCRRALTLEESLAADFDVRLRSIWPYMIRRAKAFVRTLYRQEKISTDLEDTLVELWIVLREREDSYPRDRPYLCWAKPVIDNTLSRLRETSRTISSPKDTAYRVHGYLERSLLGNLSTVAQQTWADIERSIRGTYGDGVQPGTHTAIGLAKIADLRPAPDDVRQGQSEAASALIAAIKSTLSLREATVLGKSGGLWGLARKNDQEIARDMGLNLATVRTIKAEAYGKVRDYLTEIHHPIRCKVMGSPLPSKSPRQRAM